MTASSASTRPFWALTWLHARYGFVETVRVPIAVLGNVLFPGLALLFFVVPNAEVATDRVSATAAVAQLGAFAVMSSSLFTYGLGVSEDRALPFDGFLRTLPAPAGPRLAGRVLNGLAWSYLSLLPLVLLGALTTAAGLTWAQAGGLVLLVAAVAIPFTLLGLAYGYSLAPKAAIAVVQVTVFPLAFAGGMFLPPQLFPHWLDAVSLATPSRSARDLVVQVTTGIDPGPWALPVLAGWTALFVVAAVVAYRRDEGRRYR
jgi:ABC-2 type transport system permease protein